MTHVGFGVGRITPPLPVHLAGFSGRAGPATEVHDDLEARVTLLSSGETTVCLVVCDLLGMSAEFADPVRAAVGEALGLPRDAVLTACVHTHAGPNALGGGERLGWPTPPGYLGVLVEGCVQAARAARAAAEPAELRFARGPLPAGLSVNRRGNVHDPWFSLLEARSLGGAPLGTLANIAVHPVALGREVLAVSSDWVGVYRNRFEALTGGRAVVLSGALGDVNPHLHHDEEGSYADAAAVGEGIAAAAASLLPAAAEVGDGVSVVATRSIVAPVSGMLADIAGVGDSMTVELVEWEVGDVRLVSVPGEAFESLGRAIAASRGDRVLLAGLSPVWQGYLPDPFGEGYEEQVSFGPGAVAAIRAALVDG